MSNFDDYGYVKITWNNRARDSEFYAYRVYRKSAASSDWSLLGEVYTNQISYEFYDYTAASGALYNYTVVQVAARFGVLVESNYISSDVITPQGTHYWLINEEDPAQSFKLEHVTQDDFTDVYEEEVMHVLGRGRKTDLGDRLGYEGTLTATLRDTDSKSARQQRLELEALKLSRVRMMLRNPFGDVIPVSIGNLQFGRIAGRGVHEDVIVSIPIREVA